jgi:hypothetical protein
MFFLLGPKQCSGSVRFWYGTGSSVPYLCLTDPDANLAPDADPAPDPALFAGDLQDGNNNKIFSPSFYAYSYLMVHLHHIQFYTSDKKS